MHFERLLVENVRRLGSHEYDFTAGPGRLRRWNLLPAGVGSSALLRALALAGLGQRQLEALAEQPALDVAERAEAPAHLEFVQIREAPQERGPASPARRHLGWCVSAGGGLRALRGAAMRYRDPAAQAGCPELGRSNVGRLLLGYGSRVQAQAGTDSFDIHPDQRLRRCAGLFDLEARLTDPVAFLERLQHKSRYRAGRARAVLARLNAGLSEWLGWDAGGCLGREGAFETRWLAMLPPVRSPAIVALDIARHTFDAATHLDHPDPLQQPGVAALDGLEAWCEAGRQPQFFRLLEAWFPQIQFYVTLSPAGRRRFPARPLEQVLLTPQPQSRAQPPRPRRLPRGAVLLADVDGTLPNLALNFNQTLDLRRLTPASARLLRRIWCANPPFTRRNFYFSLNDARRLELVRERYALLQTTGRDNVEFVCMYGFETSLAEDVQRFQFLRSLPGAYVFMQRYRPVPGGPAPDLGRLFEGPADALLDELVDIVFPQNMKSMETYYRWLALQYAAQRGRIHHRLVQTLFRYNGRPRMGGFLHRLEQMRQVGDCSCLLD